MARIIDWLPGWTRVDLGPDGGPFDETAHPKACIHTTEGGSLAGAEAAYAAYPPHLGYDPRYRIKHQYVRLDRHSYAFRGAESDDECVIQVEVVGRAAETHTWPDEWYRNFAEDVIVPLRALCGIPDQHLRFCRADEGIVLARSTSPIRLSDAQLRAYSGWLGHQHIPAPDEHWDPGGFLFDKALAYVQEDDVNEVQDGWLKATHDRVLGTTRQRYLTNDGKTVTEVTPDAPGARPAVLLDELDGNYIVGLLAGLDAKLDRVPAGGGVDIAALADALADEIDRRARARADLEV